MRFLILFAVLIAYASASSVLDLAKSESEWNIFKQQYGKTYQSEIEEEFRRKIFMDNKRKIEEHNEQFEKGLVSYKMGLNKYADLLSSEFTQMKNGLKGKVNHKRNFGSQKSYVGSSNQDLPKEVDWRKRGAVTRVKTQDRICYSCWAFSATGSLEGQHFLKTGKLVELSEQNLIDCSQNKGDDGCGAGGSVEDSFYYVIKNGGIDTEKSYPFKGGVGLCKFNASNIGATAKSFVKLPYGDEEKLKEAVATIGPISSGIDFNEDFLLYSSGIYYDPYSSSSNRHQDVLVVGYGTDNETQQDYWIVKNSWGTEWGEKGYFRLARNRNNNCEIVASAIFPIV